MYVNYTQTKKYHLDSLESTSHTHAAGRGLMTRRRSKLEIYLDVLGVIRNGTKKPTRIMYEANISWKPLQRILESLVSQGFLREVDARDGRDKRTSTFYEITQKGDNVIEYFNGAKHLLDPKEIAKI